MNQTIRYWMALTAIWLCLIYTRPASAKDHPASTGKHPVKGVIKDVEGKPIGGATIQVKGTPKAVSSAADGSYSLSFDNTNATLVISYVGYATLTIEVKGRTLINVQMEEARTQLSDVMVVGYGTQKKSDVTGAISSIKNKDFKDQPVSNVAASIEGKLSGINVTQPSGTPGAGLLVSVRGAQNPLYVVDAIPSPTVNTSSLPTPSTPPTPSLAPRP